MVLHISTADMATPWSMNINEIVQPHIDCETVTQYTAGFIQASLSKIQGLFEQF